jgi:hypothetical protein
MDHDDNEDRSPGRERLRLGGAEGGAAHAPDGLRSGALAVDPARRRQRRWGAASRQTMLVTRWMAGFFIFAVLVGWPLGKFLAYYRSSGSGEGWSYFGALDLGAFLLGVFVPLLTILVGYVMSRLQQMMGAAEDIATAARQFIQPNESAADNARSVGLVVREQMDALNVGLDGALNRLASVEAMIRKHVQAIESAGHAVERHATGAVSKVAEERVRLIELTEHLNAQADAFARAIAEKARASIDSIQSADDISERAQIQLEERLQRLDGAARTALESFNALSSALAHAHDSVAGARGALDAAALETKAAGERATKAADAAAETAARNAANVGASSLRAAEEAKRAADAAIEAAAREAERASRAAYDAAGREAKRVSDASSAILGEVRQATESFIGKVAADADKAAAAAERMSDAARLSSEAAGKASEDVSRASEVARRTAESALKAAEQSAKASEVRQKALAEARAALEAENARLESLIEEQRKRADRLADAIAAQTERLAKLAEAQLREQEAAARLATQAALKAREEEAARAQSDAERRKAEEAARAEQERARADQRAREEAERARAEHAAAQPAESQPRAAREPEKPEAAAPMQKPSLVERAMGAGDKEGVLDLGKATAAGPRKSGKQKSAAARRDAGDPPLTLSNGEAPDGRDAKRGKDSVSWREILDATDDAEPLDLGKASAGSSGDDSIRIIGELQKFTLDLETRLYGEPPAALRERFERGDRNVFANRLLRLNEADVKRRIRMEADRDRAFERGIQEFLQGFERLLEDATTSQTADEDLEEYLSSPLGRVYLLIGAMVGYFA